MDDTTTTDPARRVEDLFTPGALEVVAWLRFRSAAHLHAAAQAMHALWRPDDPPPPTPEPERRFYALTWPVNREAAETVANIERATGEEPTRFNLDDAGQRWGYGFWIGTIMGAWAAAYLTGEHGLAVEVYAIRVQPEGARFPATYQYAAAGAAPAGATGHGVLG
jgi:hypothetical protein